MPRNRYKVRLARAIRSEHVEADYFKVQDGRLAFRCWPGRGENDGYPVFVKCYAAGAWHSVEAAQRKGKVI